MMMPDLTVHPNVQMGVFSHAKFGREQLSLPYGLGQHRTARHVFPKTHFDGGPRNAWKDTAANHVAKVKPPKFLQSVITTPFLHFCGLSTKAIGELQVP